MSDKKFMFLFLSGMGLLLAGLVTYLFVTINQNVKRKEKEVNYEEIRTLNPDEKIFQSKTQAYESSDRDSFMAVREENVNVDFKRLFNKSKKAGEDITPDPEGHSETLQSTTSTIAPTKVYRKTYTPKSEAMQKAYPVVSPPSGSSPAKQQPDPVASTSQPAQPATPRRRDSFYGSGGQLRTGSEKELSLLKVVVHGSQEVYSGSTVKFRTIAPFMVSEVEIPSNTFVYGTASFIQERVKVSVTSVYFKGKIYALKFSVFDRDGIEGIYVPGLLVHDISKEAVRDAINDTRIDIPYIGDVPVNIARKKNNQSSAMLTQDYEVILK